MSIEVSKMSRVAQPGMGPPFRILCLPHRRKFFHGQGVNVANDLVKSGTRRSGKMMHIGKIRRRRIHTVVLFFFEKVDVNISHSEF